MKKKIAIFASGAGSNALNLLARAKEFSNIEISCVIVDTETSPLPRKLKQDHPELPVHKILPRPEISKLERKKEFERRLVEQLDQHQVSWILLAGYMRMIGPTLLERFPQNIINIHPSILPAYPGLMAYERAFAEGASESGITIHLVDSGMDTGPIILQEKFSRLSSDKLEDFIQRGKEVEWRLYPEILKKLNDSAKLLPGA